MKTCDRCGADDARHILEGHGRVCDNCVVDAYRGIRVGYGIRAHIDDIEDAEALAARREA